MIKRLVDVVAGSILALLALPVVVVLALGLIWSMRCSPFFVQPRVGRGGRLFPCWKLRTLPKSAPADADKYAIRTVDIPPFARFLRSTHLDELPQLFLVPIGLMTLVGPRPDMPNLHSRGDPEFASARTSMRPGCTGLWQASVDQDRLIWEAPEYDLFYLHHATLRLDVWILWRTVATALGLRPPVSLDDVPANVLDRPFLRRSPAHRAGDRRKNEAQPHLPAPARVVG